MTKSILKFQTGRGGNFNNSGYVTFVEFESITDGMTMEYIYEQEDGTYLDDSGNGRDIEINEDGTGYVNMDHDYDTTTCALESDLNEKQIKALVRAYEKKDHWNNDEMKRILDEYYEDYIS